MSDIVERLREMESDMIGPYRRLTLEAALEIERLREKLGFARETLDRFLKDSMSRARI